MDYPLLTPPVATCVVKKKRGNQTAQVGSEIDTVTGQNA